MCSGILGSMPPRPKEPFLPNVLPHFLKLPRLLTLLLLLQAQCWALAHAGAGNTARTEHSAIARLEAWHKLVSDLSGASESQQLQQVNRFFNTHIRYAEDVDLWDVSDYWASPEETLGRGAGDCEDFALAKYFTLRQLGVAPEHLRLLYTTLASNGQAHMVLAYWPTPQHEALILDNLDADLTPLLQRQDLSIQFAFDARHLYKLEGETLRAVANADLLSAWRNLLQRMTGAELSLAQLQP